MTIWQVLGVSPDAERDAIRRAYARKLRSTNPEDDPEGFKVLRAAYEQALRQADWRTTWAQDDDDAGDTVWHDGDSPLVDLGEAPPPVADGGPATDPQELEREAELAILRERMGALEAGLRGPWRASDAELVERLRAIVEAEAMGDLAVRDDVEPWLADLIADTVPASDAILREAIDAFHWDEGSPSHHHAVAGVIERLEEWRLIAALGGSGHTYHAGWRSLTRAPGSPWRWRLDALRPGVRRGASALLGWFGDMTPGLRHSFNAASVERWEAFLAVPRLTFGMLLQVPALFLALYWLGYAVFGRDPPVVVVGLAALPACAAPLVTLFVLAPLQRRSRHAYGPDWLRQAWLAAYGVMLVSAGLLPGTWPVALALPALGIAIWAFLTDDVEPVGQAKDGSVILFGAIALFLTIGLIDVITPAQGFALGVAAALYLYLRLRHRDAAAGILGWRLGERREWWLLFLVIAVTSLGTAIAILRESWAPTIAFYPIALCLLALALPVGVTEPGRGPPRGIAMAILVLTFLAAGVASIPDEPADKPVAAVPVSPGDRSGDSVLFDAGTAPRALAALERAQPAFAGVRAGDPILYAELRAELEKFYDGQATRRDAMAAFTRRVDTAYRARLPETDAALVIESQRIRLATLRALRRADVAACADESKKAFDPALLTREERLRQNAQIYRVLARPPVPRAQQGTATPVSGEQLLRGTAKTLGISATEAGARLDDKSDPRLRCDAQIALLTTLVDMPQDAVVAMVRQSMRRHRAR